MKLIITFLCNSQIGEHTLVLYSVVGWNSYVGSWSRVEGTPDDPNPNKPFAKMDNNPLFNASGQLNPSITILHLKSRFLLLKATELVSQGPG